MSTNNKGVSTVTPGTGSNLSWGGITTKIAEGGNPMTVNNQPTPDSEDVATISVQPEVEQIVAEVEPTEDELEQIEAELETVEAE